MEKMLLGQLRVAEGIAAERERRYGSNHPETRAAEAKAIKLMRRLEALKEKRELATFK